MRSYHPGRTCTSSHCPSCQWSPWLTFKLLHFLPNFGIKLYGTDFIKFLIFHFYDIFDFINHQLSSHSRFFSSSFNYTHLNLPFEPVIVSFVLNFSAPFKTYTNGNMYLVRRQLDPCDHGNAWLYDDHPTRPCSHHGPFYRPCPVCLKNSPVNEIITLHTFRHIPITPAPNVLISFCPEDTETAPSAYNPTCTSVLMLLLCPLPPLFQRRYPTSQPNNVRPLEGLLDIYLLKNNHLHMLLNPFFLIRLLYKF